MEKFEKLYLCHGYTFSIMLKVSVVFLISILIPMQIVFGQTFRDLFTQEEIKQYALNNTSIDQKIKEKFEFFHNEGINDTMLYQGINGCTSLYIENSGSFTCDLLNSFVFEICQAIPNYTIYCNVPQIYDYLDSRNLTDGKTDVLSWLLLS